MRKLLAIGVLAFVVTLSACTVPTEVTCGEGTIKVDGKCEVETFTCEDGFTLVDEACVEDEEPLICDEGYTVVEGACVEDEVPLECEEGFTLTDGECIEDEVPLECIEGFTLIDGECVEDDEPLVCDEGYHIEFGACVMDALVCDAGYHEEDGECVENVVVEEPEWFDGWTILTEPVGDLTVNDLLFTETGFSVNLPAGKRVGIIKNNLHLEPGFSYELRFTFSTDTPGMAVFAQLQGHGGYSFTHSNIVANETTQQFSDTLAFSPEATETTGAWLTIELLPSGTGGTITIDSIELIKTALPTCGENEVLRGLECEPANNGFLPNGTPTAWFEGWAILQGPAGNKDISDYEFTETGFTAYLAANERTGIQLMDYVFESGYTYELTFDYTASAAGRMVWVQMEALGGYGFTNTDTWTVAGTGTFSQTLTIPDTYVPTETGWIKLELTPGGMDNVTIDNIQIIKTPNQ